MRTFRRLSKRRNTGQRAFTLIEVLIVIAIVAILASLAAPSFSDLIKSQKVKSTASDLNAALALARSEAVKRNRDVTMSPATAGNWQDGWQIADPDNAGINIEVHAAIAGLTVTGPASVIYRSSGRVSGTTAPAFDISAAGGTAHACVSADLSGRPYIKAAAC